MPRLRRCATVALALVLSLFAVVPHQHDGLAESLFDESSVTQIGTCDAPQARHFHAAETEAAHPCVACVRQHSAGALRALAVTIERPVVAAAHAAATAPTPVSSIPVSHLRGPPAW